MILNVLWSVYANFVFSNVKPVTLSKDQLHQFDHSRYSAYSLDNIVLYIKLVRYFCYIFFHCNLPNRSSYDVEFLEAIRSIPVITFLYLFEKKLDAYTSNI